MDIAKCSLAELIEDPLVGLVMKSDGVDRREIEVLFARVARERASAINPPDRPASGSGLPPTEAAPCSRC